ncbi:MAG: phosphoglucomutase/phosphomannomutase family protein [Dehalococcoidia bacterium]|nr:MAG: phosphoglucomutase/phosphomannomutase family protein [Dehalococcoidia bacterium]
MKFGTDGWRAVIADEFTFKNVRRCTQGVADYLKDAHLSDKGIVIGYDTRFASADFAGACAEVLAANRIKVYLSEAAVPTPVVSYAVANLEAGGGIIITASHNPARWNGFKYKSPDGASAPDDVVTEIEKQIAAVNSESIKTIPLSKAIENGMVVLTDFKSAYRQQIGRLLDMSNIRKARLNIAVDSMHGAGGGYFKTLLGEGATRITEIKAKPNPVFPGMKQPEPIGVNLYELSEAVRREKASVGLATDGDADRLGVMDEQGNFITQLQVYALLVLYFFEVRGERGPIVKTITTTSMLNRLGEIYSAPVFEVPVGFKYVAPVMLRENALIGGEESGGYGFRGHVPERDGLLAGLYFLDFMARTGKTPSQLLDYLYQKVGPHYYDRRDSVFDESRRGAILERIAESTPASLDGVKVLRKETADGFRFLLEDGGWLLVRFSGTEPLLRVYAESKSLENVQRLLDIGLEMAGVKESA